MNILYLCDEYPPGKHGGIGTSVQLLAREMVRQGHNVIVAGFYDWGYGGEDVFEDKGVKVFRFRRSLVSKFFRNGNALYVRGMYRLLKMAGILQWDIKRSLKKYHTFLERLISENKIDIAEIPDYQDYMRFCNSYVPFPKLSVPTVIKLHGTMTYFAEEAGKHPPRHIWQMEHDLLRQVDAVAGVSKYTSEKTANYLDYPKTIDVIHNGIDATTISFDQPIKKQPLRVTYTGSLVVKKGIYQLVKAWNIVIEKLPDATLWIYGKGHTEKLKAMMNEHAAKTISFKGHVSREELMKQLAGSEIAVFPSYAECFALAPMEAMACETAVIFSTRTSGPELINDNVDGLLVDPDNVNEIANKIIFLLKHSDICREIAEKGKQRVKNNFDIQIIAEKNIQFYQTTIYRNS
jgi:glycosyltransferase involved in cell wall biosynthesis